MRQSYNDPEICQYASRVYECMYSIFRELSEWACRAPA